MIYITHVSSYHRILKSQKLHEEIMKEAHPAHSEPCIARLALFGTTIGRSGSPKSCTNMEKVLF